MVKSPSTLSARFVANLKRLMAENSISQTALASRAEISQGMVSLLLSSQRDPTLGTVEKIANALDVDVSDLLKGATVSDLSLASPGDYESLVDSPAWLVRLDEHFRIVWANQNLLDFYELKSSDLEGLTLPELMTVIGRSDRVQDERERLEQDRQAAQEHKLVMYTRKDETGDLLVVKVPLADEGMLAIGVPLPDHVVLDEIESDLQNALKLIQAAR